MAHARKRNTTWQARWRLRSGKETSKDGFPTKKAAEAFGFQQPQTQLKVIDAVDEATGERVNPFAAFIADAAANMTSMDKSGLRNLD